MQRKQEAITRYFFEGDVKQIFDTNGIVEDTEVAYIPGVLGDIKKRYGTDVPQHQIVYVDVYGNQVEGDGNRVINNVLIWPESRRVKAVDSEGNETGRPIETLRFNVAKPRPEYLVVGYLGSTFITNPEKIQAKQKLEGRIRTPDIKFVHVEGRNAATSWPETTVKQRPSILGKVHESLLNAAISSGGANDARGISPARLVGHPFKLNTKG